MPTVRVHVRAADWNRSGWRDQFEADLVKTGWRISSVEPPTAERADYVYVVTLELAPRESASSEGGPSKPA